MKRHQSISLFKSEKKIDNRREDFKGIKFIKFKQTEL